MSTEHIPEEYNVDAMFDPSPYICAHDLKGRDVTLTMAHVKADLLTAEGGKKNRKPVISFKETDKKLAIGKTNKKTIVKLYGRDVREWIGKRVTLFATTTKSLSGDTVPCIRIRPSVPAERRPPQGQQRREEPPPPPREEQNVQDEPGAAG